LIDLQVNQGFGLGAREDDRARITFYAGPALNSDPTKLPRRRLAAFETREHNVPDAVEPGGNENGWAREWERWFRAVEAALTAQTPTLANSVLASIDGVTTLWSKITNAMVDSAAGIEWTKFLGVGTEIYEPSGWPQAGEANDANVTLNYVEGTRTLTLTHASDYSFWAAGQRFTKTANESIVWPDFSGTHFFYFDNTGALQTTQSTDTWINEAIGGDGCPVAALYWNATEGEVLWMLDERHGMMPGETHKWAHEAISAQWIEGGALSGFTFGDGSLDAHAQFDVENVIIRDEDIRVSVVAGDPRTQTMSPATMRGYFKLGSEWNYKDPDGFACLQGGASYQGGTVPAGRLRYNEITGGVGTIPEVPNNNAVLAHIGVTTEGSGYSADGSSTNWRLFYVVGQGAYGTVGDAKNAALLELNQLQLDGFPLEEVVWLGTVAFQTRNTDANAVSAHLEQPDDALGNPVDYIDQRNPSGLAGGGGGSGGVTDHGLLTGLSDTADHTWALLVDGTRQATYLDALNYLTIGTNAAASGVVRVANAAYHKARNAANSADLSLLGLNSSDELELGESGVSNITATASTAFQASVGGVTRMIVQGSFTSFYSSLLLAGDYVSIGVNAATTGALRLVSQGYIKARNAANSTDLTLIGLNITDSIDIGSTSVSNITNYSSSSWQAFVGGGTRANIGSSEATFYTNVKLGSTYISVGPAAAASGPVRIEQASYLTSRNAGNTADIELIGVAASDVVTLGTSTAGGFKAFVGAGGSSAVFDIGGASILTLTETTAEFAFSGGNINLGVGFISVGPSPAQSGGLRLPNAVWVKARNAANSADLTIIRLNSSDQVEVGPTGDAALETMSDRVHIYKFLQLSSVTPPSGTPSGSDWWFYAASDGLHAVSPSGTDTIIASI
jgi:hypothetical protein